MKYRNNILEIWDKNRKNYTKELGQILKFNLKNTYKICIIHPNLDVVETDFKSNTITIGKQIITKDKDNFLTYLIYKIVKHEILKLKTNEKDILDVVVELAITNELYTRISNKSKYKIGKQVEKVEKILTVTVPSYNVEKFLENTLNSFVDERVLDDIEVLIVDDGSKDKTAEIGRKYEECDSYIGRWYGIGSCDD